VNYTKNIRFENKDHLIREDRAIRKWINGSSATFKKLGMHDVDFLVYSKKSETYAYVEVKGRHKNIDKAYPLPIASRKLVKLYDSMNRNGNAYRCFVIWACEDGIISGDMDKIVGQCRSGGRMSRNGSSNDWEMMVYYDKQTELKQTLY
tara:strand:+ start:1370 stop:1816 length:447 start_codon:yes stop_codon:yes gene_type:complete